MLLPDQKIARLSSCFLFMALFWLPYAVDVAYCGDLSPSHFGQALLGDGEDKDPIKAKAYLSVPFNLGLDSLGLLAKDVVPVWGCSSHQTVLFSQYPFLSFLTSRPPPLSQAF